MDKWVCMITIVRRKPCRLHVQVAEQQGKYLACMIK